MSDMLLVTNIFLACLSQTVGWLVGVLPSSPFANISLSLSAVPNALGWLNWVVPVGDCLQLYAAWLACASAWQVAQFVKAKFTFDDMTPSKSLPSSSRGEQR